MSRVELTDEEFSALFQEFPLVRKSDNGLPTCPYCGNALNDENLEIFGFQTEAGTDGTSFEIECDVCRKFMWHGGTWGSDFDKSEVIEELGESLSEWRDFEREWVLAVEKG